MLDGVGSGFPGRGQHVVDQVPVRVTIAEPTLQPPPKRRGQAVSRDAEERTRRQVAEHRAGRRQIVIGCHRYHHVVVATVRDSGPGLNSGSEDMVFEPFYTTKPGGMGMGLSIVRSIVEAHGGIIHAINLAGGGALVEFQLPAAEPMPV